MGRIKGPPTISKIRSYMQQSLFRSPLVTSILLKKKKNSITCFEETWRENESLSFRPLFVFEPLIIYIYIWIFEKKKKIERFNLYEISRIRYFIFLFLRNFLLWKNPTLFPRKYKYKYINNIFDRKGGKEIAIKKKIGHNGAPLNSWTPLDRSAWQDRSRDAPPSPLFLKLRQRCWIGEEKYSYTGTVHNYAVISFSLFFFLPTISSYLRTTTLPKTYLHTRGE